MIDLLYLSHTTIPAHLEELEGLDLLNAGEQVLVALDGVLLDSNGRRISGPTLHDYCLLTNMRVLLWARDYGRHLCYAFPLTELCMVEGVGLDPLHAHVHMSFAESGEEEQRFTLTLLPLADLPAAVTLLRVAADTAQVMASQGMDSQDAAPDIVAVLSEQIFGSVDGMPPPETPYRWSGEEAPDTEAPRSSPSMQFDSTNVPPGQLYNVSRIGRAAWDTVHRTLREAELPFNVSGNDMRSMAEAIRALNELLTTVAGNPGAREVIMAFLRRRGGESDIFTPTSDQSGSSHAATEENQAEPSQATPPESGDYHEIPLRRRHQEQKDEPARNVLHSSASLTSDRGDTIPLRRRGGERRS